MSMMLAKDGMQMKPGLLYYSKQGNLVGSTLNPNYNYIGNDEPDRDVIKPSLVQEVEIWCLRTLDAKFFLPVGVHNLSKGLTAAETSAMMKKEA